MSPRSKIALADSHQFVTILDLLFSLQELFYIEREVLESWRPRGGGKARLSESSHSAFVQNQTRGPSDLEKGQRRKWRLDFILHLSPPVIPAGCEEFPWPGTKFGSPPVLVNKRCLGPRPMWKDGMTGLTLCQLGGGHFQIVYQENTSSLTWIRGRLYFSDAFT